MLLGGKVAVIHGGAGAIGGAVARNFAREGATVFLAGRHLDKVEAVAREIADAGGQADAQQVDALDEAAIERHLLGVVRNAGRIDIEFNAVGLPVVQGIPLTDLKQADFVAPIASWTTTQFLTARAAARHMLQQRSGVDPDPFGVARAARGRHDGRIWCCLCGDRGPVTDARRRAQSAGRSCRVHPVASDQRNASRRGPRFSDGARYL